MIQKRFSEFDLSGENTVDVDNDGPHYALLDAEEVKQKPESNPVYAVCHRHFALNASGIVRRHGQKLNRCPGLWQDPIFSSSFQDRSTLPPTPDPSLNQANLAISHVKSIKRIPRAARSSHMSDESNSKRIYTAKNPPSIFRSQSVCF